MDNYFLESAIFIAVSVFSTAVLAPRAVRYFLRWKTNQKISTFVVSVLYALAALFLISVLFLIFITHFIDAKFPF